MVLSVSHGIGLKHTAKQEAYLTVCKWHKYTTDMNKQLYFFLDTPLPNGRMQTTSSPATLHCSHSGKTVLNLVKRFWSRGVLSAAQQHQQHRPGCVPILFEVLQKANSMQLSHVMSMRVNTRPCKGWFGGVITAPQVQSFSDNNRAKSSLNFASHVQPEAYTMRGFRQSTHSYSDSCW